MNKSAVQFSSVQLSSIVLIQRFMSPLSGLNVTTKSSIFLFLASSMLDLSFWTLIWSGTRSIGMSDCFVTEVKQYLYLLRSNIGISCWEWYSQINFKQYYTIYDGHIYCTYLTLIFLFWEQLKDNEYLLQILKCC